MRKVLVGILFLLITYIVIGQNDINPNGYNKIYYPNGSIQSEGILRDGKPEGYWISYYATGTKKSEGKRKNGLLDSIWVFYNLTGDTVTKINYLDGKKNGFSYEYFTDNFTIKGKSNIYSKELYVNDLKEGKSFYYNKNGNIKYITDYHENKKEGNEIEYDDNGTIKTISRYRKGNITEQEKLNRFDLKGLKTGTWKTFYEGIHVKSEANYRNDLLEGYYKEYDVNGKLVLTLLYREGKLVENVAEDQILSEEKKEYYPDGNIKEIGLYKHGKPIGLHKNYNKQGNVAIAEIFSDDGILLSKGNIDDDGNKIGIWEEYFKNGKTSQKGNYKENKRDGKWDFYNVLGGIEQTGTYKEGVFTDKWEWYYSNGKLWKDEEYLNGLLDGVYNEYDTNGNIIVKGEYLEGEREGEWVTIINDNKAVGKYVSGLMDGKWKTFYNDGTLAFEGSFIQGNPNGKHKYYYPDGTLKEEQFFNQGIKENNWKKYNKDGDLFLTITYKDDKEFRINGTKVDFPVETVKMIK